MTAATQQSQAQSAHTPSASANTDPSSNSDDLSWENDRMFNIYIWDYCVKRGYSNTARELAEEAKLNPNPRPPIDAKQGLLYEWWSVFWLLFSTKSNNQGPEDAMAYIQNHHSRMQPVPGAMARYPNGLQRLPGGPGAMHTLPNPLGAGAPPHPGIPNQPPNAPPMTNGVGPAAPGQQQVGQSQAQGPHSQQQTPGQQQPPQAPPPLGFPAGHVSQPQSQPNGVPTHGRPPVPGQPHSGSIGVGQPGRPGMPFYQSPTMAHQQAGGPTGPPPPYPGGPPNMYPQHMRGMLPPGVPNGIPGAGVGGSPGFPQSNTGTGSRAATPAQPGGSSLTQPSPSMQHRTVPATPPNFGGMAVPGGRGPPFDQLNAEILRIDAAILNELRQELHLENKDLPTWSMDEKTHLLTTYKSRNAPGPSNPTRPQGRGSKRNSVSPGDEHAEIPTKGEVSPPAQKRARRSPEQAAPSVPGPAGSAPQAGSSNVNTNQNLPVGMYPPNVPHNGIRPGPSFTPQMGPMGMGQVPPPNMMMAPGMVNPQMPFQKNATQQYHANLQAMHKIGVTDSQQQMQQPQFAGDPNQGRPAPPAFGGQRPGMNQGKMLPPSSPATNANASGQGKPPLNAQSKTETGGKADSSPRNGPPPPPPGTTRPSPPTPASGPSVPSPLANQSRPTTSTSNPPSGATGPAPPQPVPAPPASAPPAPAPDPTGMSFDFMSTGIDDFTLMFGRDDPTVSMTDLDHDFGNWFGGSDITGIDSLSR